MTIHEEIETELARALAKYPDCASLPDGTGGAGRKTYETIARNACDRAYREGRLTHAHVFEEETSEVLAAEDPTSLRKELVQVGAMIVKWVRDIDRKSGEACGVRCLSATCSRRCDKTLGHDDRHGHDAPPNQAAHTWPVENSTQHGEAEAPATTGETEATAGPTAGAGAQRAPVGGDSAAPAPAPAVQAGSGQAGVPAGFALGAGWRMTATRLENAMDGGCVFIGGRWQAAAISQGALVPLAPAVAEVPTGCLCANAEVAATCVGNGVCSTVERWAHACRAAHWFEDDALGSWEEFVSLDTSEVETWRRVARDAIRSLNNDPEDLAFMAAHPEVFTEAPKAVEPAPPADSAAGKITSDEKYNQPGQISPDAPPAEVPPAAPPGFLVVGRSGPARPMVLEPITPEPNPRTGNPVGEDAEASVTGVEATAKPSALPAALGPAIDLLRRAALENVCSLLADDIDTYLGANITDAVAEERWGTPKADAIKAAVEAERERCASGWDSVEDQALELQRLFPPGSDGSKAFSAFYAAVVNQVAAIRALPLAAAPGEAT